MPNFSRLNILHKNPPHLPNMHKNNDVNILPPGVKSSLSFKHLSTLDLDCALAMLNTVKSRAVDRSTSQF